MYQNKINLDLEILHQLLQGNSKNLRLK